MDQTAKAISADDPARSHRQATKRGVEPLTVVEDLDGLEDRLPAWALVAQAWRWMSSVFRVDYNDSTTALSQP